MLYTPFVFSQARNRTHLNNRHLSSNRKIRLFQTINDLPGDKVLTITAAERHGPTITVAWRYGPTITLNLATHFNNYLTDIYTTIIIMFCSSVCNLEVVRRHQLARVPRFDVGIQSMWDDVVVVAAATKPKQPEWSTVLPFI